MISTRTILSAAAAVAASAQLGAQTPGAAPRAAAAASASYNSAFEGYRPFEAGEVEDWRKSNDTVREAGGWRAYAREIHGGQQPASPPQAPPAAATQPKAGDPHRGHRQ